MIGSRPHLSHTSPRLPDPGGEAGIALAFIAVPVIWTGFALPLAVAEITVEAVFFALVGAACSGMTLAGFRLIYLRHATQGRSS